MLQKKKKDYGQLLFHHSWPFPEHQEKKEWREI